MPRRWQKKKKGAETFVGEADAWNSQAGKSSGTMSVWSDSIKNKGKQLGINRVM